MNTFFRARKTLLLTLVLAHVTAGAAELEEIVVTAQKRSESLQDVPISMTALDGKRMEDAGVASFAELANYVPNFSISENAVNTIITMRGISIGANQSFEQPVGIYIDGVHYGKSRHARNALFDMQQVEVLRGPQGILFGKNTLAGAVNITTAEPTLGAGTSGQVAVSAESYDGEIVEASANYSPSEKMGFRVAFKDRQREGYNDNSFANEVNGYATEMPSTDETMFRVTAVLQPTDNTVIKLKHSQSEHTRVGGPGVVTTFTPSWASPLSGQAIAASNALMYGVMNFVHPGYAANVASGALDPYRDGISLGGLALAQSLGRDLDLDPSNRANEKPEGTDTETDETTLNIEVALDNGYTFTSVTGFGGYEYEDGIDADFLPVRFIGRSDISEFSQKSQEFRLTSPAGEKFTFVTGLYYQSMEQEIDRMVVVDGTLGAGPVLGATPGVFCNTFLALPPAMVGPLYCARGLTAFDSTGRKSNWKQDTDSWAAFFQGTYQISDTLSVTAGLRYTEEEKEVHAETSLGVFHTGNTLFGNYTYTGVFQESNDPGLAGINASSFATWAHVFDEERSTDQLMPAMNLEWNPSETTMYYLSYAEGFKTGGFNAVDDQNPAFLPDGTPLRTTPGLGFEYDDETAKSIEFGGKHIMMDGALNLNWNMFFSEYDDQQVSTFVGLGFVVANAASTEIKGLEVDIAFQATENLRLGAAFAYLDGNYDEFTGAGCTAAQASAILAMARAEPGGGADGNPATLDTSSPVISADGCTAKFNATGSQSGLAQDLSDKKLTSAEYTGVLTADYVRPIRDGMVWFASVDVQFTDDYLMTGDLDPIDSQKGFENINVRTGIRTDRWGLMLYGRNVSDKLTATGAADVPLAAGSHFQYRSIGDVWGARLTFRF